MLLVLRRLQARDAELRAALEHLIAHGDDFADYRPLLAAVQARMGSTTDALDTLARLRADGFGSPRTTCGRSP